MGMRFRKYVTLAPGVRLNLSGSGASMRVGPRGASVNVGSRGTYLNTGIPGTGIYARERIGGASSARSSSTSSHTSTSFTVGVTDDGTIYFKDAAGNPLSDSSISAAKRQHGTEIHNLIQKKCDDINARIEALGKIHLYTPNPNLKPQYQKQVYRESSPVKPDLKKPGFMDSLISTKRDEIERDNAERERQYQEALAKWQLAKQHFDEAEQRRKDTIERGIYTDVATMEKSLEEKLQSITWPRETIVSFEILNGGERIFADVDLPEIENFPDKTASAPKSGYKLSVKKMTSTKVQQLYMNHVHGIGFRIIGEIFAALPNAREVILSAFSQRPDRVTGNASNEYLYSVRVGRDAWSQINFSNLRSIDVIESLGQFEIRRNMTKTGVFKTIEPFSPSS